MRTLIISLAVLALGSTFARSDRATYDDTKTQIALRLDTPPVIDTLRSSWIGFTFS